MTLYERWIFPRLVDLVMRNKEVSRYRERVVPGASGTVLEIGAGSGLNLPHYSPDIEHVYALDPSPELLRMAQRTTEAARRPVHFIDATAEAIPMADGAVDTVLVTFSLCTIPDPIAALREMKRVLKPGGRLWFAEHGLAPDASVQRWQRRCNGVWRALAGGCNLDRPIDKLITASGFRIEKLGTEYARGPRPLSFIYWGSAIPDAAASR